MNWGVSVFGRRWKGASAPVSLNLISCCLDLLLLQSALLQSTALCDVCYVFWIETDITYRSSQLKMESHSIAWWNAIEWSDENPVNLDLTFHPTCLCEFIYRRKAVVCKLSMDKNKIMLSSTTSCWLWQQTERQDTPRRQLRGLMQMVEFLLPTLSRDGCAWYLKYMIILLTSIG